MCRNRILYNHKRSCSNQCYFLRNVYTGIARDINNEALVNIDQLDLVFTVYYLVGNSTTPTVILTRTATVKTDNFGVFLMC